jgi:diguanylate cyclase (GGDEF)-like protein
VIGLLALFRAADGADFEPPDSSILEFMGRKAVNLLNNRYDGLTGLLNRYAFEHDASLKLQSDNAAATAALLYLDIDGLNVINTAFGFQAGDEIIQRLAVVIRNAVTEEDIAGRLGGDRFAVLLPPSRADGDAALAETLRAEMGELTYLQGEEAIPVSVSIGIGRCAESNQSIGHAIAAAEYACKRAKELGRNRVEISHDDNAFSVAHRNDALAFASLQDALKANRFSLEVQSIHHLQDEPGIIGYETLTRMRDGEGLVGPDKFLAAAQRYHLMPALDRWVIVEALRNLQSSENELTRSGWVSLNVSAQSFKSDSFRAFLIEQLVASGIQLESLCIELRESSAAHNMRAAEELIYDLRELGVMVALDNFGRGLSSLAYLRRLPVNYIKIAGDLVRQVATDRLAESMVMGIAQAAAMLGIETIAEHVETEAIAKKLRQLDVLYGQGYYFSRPQPMSDEVPKSVQDNPTARLG